MLNTNHLSHWADPLQDASNYLEACESNQLPGEQLNQTSVICDDIQNDEYQFLLSSFWHVISKLPYLFYLVWPTETMFPSLDKVPRYVTEVSLEQTKSNVIRKFEQLINHNQRPVDVSRFLCSGNLREFNPAIAR